MAKKSKKKCGFGKIWDSDKNASRKMSHDEKVTLNTYTAVGAVAGAAVGQIAGPKGMAAGYLIGGYKARKKTKKAIREKRLRRIG